MPRDKATGKAKGFAFVMYEDQRSTVLAVDNMNGVQVLGRTLRVSLPTVHRVQSTFHLGFTRERQLTAGGSLPQVQPAWGEGQRWRAHCSRGTHIQCYAPDTRR